MPTTTSKREGISNMPAAQVDPRDRVRSRDVNKVARGEQVPAPVHECGQINRAHGEHAADKDVHREQKAKEKHATPGTAPADIRFPTTNQTRHCYTRYIEYHKCIQEKGDDAPECEKFLNYFRSSCPVDWIEKWNGQRELGTFPEPI